MKVNLLLLAATGLMMAACQPSDDKKNNADLPVFTDILGPARFAAKTSTDGNYVENEEGYQKTLTKPRCENDAKGLMNPGNFIGQKWVWQTSQVSKGTRYNTTDTYELAKYDDVTKTMLLNRMWDQRRDGHAFSEKVTWKCDIAADTKLYTCKPEGVPVKQGQDSPNPYSKDKECEFVQTFDSQTTLMTGTYHFNTTLSVEAKVEYRLDKGHTICNKDEHTKKPATRRSILVKSAEVADFRSIPSCSFENPILSAYIIQNDDGKILDSSRQELVQYPVSKN